MRFNENSRNNGEMIMNPFNNCSFKAKLKTARTAAMATLLTFLLFHIQTAQAAHVNPVFVAGNPTCSNLITNVTGSIELKVDQSQLNIDGAPTQHSLGNAIVTVTAYTTSQGQQFDWSISGGTVYGVVAKGGPNANFYDYRPGGETSDTGLHAPVNPSNGRYFGLSHISFCFVPGAASIDVTKTCNEQSVQGEVVTTQNKAIIVNDGDFAFTKVELKETVGSLSCTIIAIDGIAANIAMPNDTFVELAGVILNPGEDAEVTIRCEGDALNVPNTVVAKGTWSGGTKEDTATSDPANQCPFSPNPMVKIIKKCDYTRLQQHELGGDNVLVLEVCPVIKVKNKSNTESLATAFVTDLKIPALANGVNVGPIAPGATVNVADFLNLPNLCYKPEAPEQEPIDLPEIGKFATEGASFLNSATVEATGLFGGEASDQDSALCPLCPAPVLE
jgi:hypothetical protein